MSFPERIETSRLILRPYVLDDLDAHVEVLSNWDVVQWLSNNVPVPYRREDGENSIREAIQKFQDGQSIQYAIEDKETGRHVGGVRLFTITAETEVGYWMHPDFWGKGLGTEVLKAAISAGFDEGTIVRFVAQTAEKNYGSQAILKKVGFVDGGVVPAEYYRDGHQEGGCTAFFTLDKADWLTQNATQEKVR
ncbi:GNAT family N-acetyltransferase [Paremcibacter congregatus]|uniref:GNAT family N-acetyltransferase n=1 Tax=Paremcibacter congregatus TaxID=2043170 RepID=UPI003A9573D4|tara:strand:- start:6271 stop:6846 length:576 start_codon:yes stop_codon:yes gene_type:complete